MVRRQRKVQAPNCTRVSVEVVQYHSTPCSMTESWGCLDVGYAQHTADPSTASALSRHPASLMSVQYERSTLYEYYMYERLVQCKWSSIPHKLSPSAIGPELSRRKVNYAVTCSSTHLATPAYHIFLCFVLYHI